MHKCCKTIVIWVLKFLVLRCSLVLLEVPSVALLLCSWKTWLQDGVRLLIRRPWPWAPFSVQHQCNIVQHRATIAIAMYWHQWSELIMITTIYHVFHSYIPFHDKTLFTCSMQRRGGTFRRELPAVLGHGWCSGGFSDVQYSRWNFACPAWKHLKLCNML